jgi:hypothetical protein
VRWPRRARRVLPELLFAALLLVHLVPVALLERFPTQDGPSHLATVAALLRHDAVPAFQRWFVPNWGLQPNWLVQLGLAGLLRLASPEGAQRALLCALVLALPLAFRLALPPTTRGRWAALAVFPFVYSYPFHMGFWSFTWGLALLFGVLGVWRVFRGRLGPGRGVALGLLLAVAYFCHPTALLAALVALSALLGWRAALALTRSRGRARRRAAVVAAYRARALGLAAAAAPAAALLARFVAAQGDHPSLREKAVTLAGKLAALYTLVSFDRREILLSLPVAVALAAAVAWRLVARGGGRRPRPRPVDGWLAAAAAFTVLYFAVPDVAASGAQIGDRLALLPYLMLTLWLGWSAGRAAELRRVAVGVAALSVAALVLRAPGYLAFERDMAEVASLEGALPRGAAVLPLTLTPFGVRPDGRRVAWRVRVFQHVTGFAAARRDLVDLDDSQASTDHAPVRFAPGRDAFRALGGDAALEGDPPCVDLGAWLARGGRPDAVVVLGAGTAAAQVPCAREAVAVVRALYGEPVVSGPRGLVAIFGPGGADGAERAAR